MPGEGVLTSLASIEATVRDHRDEAERTGRLARPVVDALKAAGVTRLYGPTSRGGFGADPVTVSRVTEQLADWDPAAAWFVMVSNAVRVGAKGFSPALFDLLWGEDIDTIVAGSGNAALKGELVEGGVVVSGRIGFVSGCHHADWLLCPLKLDDGIRTAFIPLDAVEIEDNWHVSGLRGTGSNDLTLDRVFLPDVQAMAPGRGNGNDFCDDVLFRCPGRIVFATYVPLAFVLARRALEELTALAQEKTPYATQNKLAHRSVAQIKYGKGLALYRSAYNYYYDTMQEAWDRAAEGRQASDDEKADLYLAGVHAVQASADVVRLVADVAGTSAVYLDHPLEAIVRDMEVLRHHGFANEQRFGSVAQVKWDVPLDYPLMLR